MVDNQEVSRFRLEGHVKWDSVLSFSFQMSHFSLWTDFLTIPYFFGGFGTGVGLGGYVAFGGFGT
jgi:hypothetical protein